MLAEIASPDFSPQNEVVKASHSIGKSSDVSATPGIVLVHVDIATQTQAFTVQTDKNELSSQNLPPSLRNRVYLKRRQASPINAASEKYVNSSPEATPVLNADTRASGGGGSCPAQSDLPCYVREKRRELRPLLGALRFVESSNR